MGEGGVRKSFCLVGRSTFYQGHFFSGHVQAINRPLKTLRCQYKLNSVTRSRSPRRYSKIREFPGSPLVRNPPANAGDMNSVSDLGRFQVPRGSEASAPNH